MRAGPRTSLPPPFDTRCGGARAGRLRAWRRRGVGQCGRRRTPQLVSTLSGRRSLIRSRPAHARERDDPRPRQPDAGKRDHARRGTPIDAASPAPPFRDARLLWKGATAQTRCGAEQASGRAGGAVVDPPPPLTFGHPSPRQYAAGGHVPERERGWPTGRPRYTWLLRVSDAGRVCRRRVAGPPATPRRCAAGALRRPARSRRGDSCFFFLHLNQSCSLATQSAV